MPASAAESAVKPTRNAEVSRARILAAARVEFVTQGLNGARVDRIAQKSAVNKNLIYHYFGSKDALYLEVLENIYVGLRATQNDEVIRASQPIEGMRRLVASTFDHFVETPDLIRLMSIENIHFAQHLRKSRRIKPLYTRLLDTLQELLARGQSDGVFRAKVDAVDLYLSISGLAYFFLSNQHTLSWLLDQDLVAERRIRQRRRHVVDMVLDYLTRAQDDAPDEAEPHARRSKSKRRVAGND